VDSLLEIVLVGVVLVNLAMLGASRLKSCIRFVGLQGVLIGIAPALGPAWHYSVRTAAIVAVAVVIKGLVMPWLLLRAIREAHVKREIEPFLGYTASVLLGAVLTAAAFGFAERLPVATPAAPPFLPVGLATLLAGTVLMVTRKKAVTQVIGYLMLENGIFLFGQGLGAELPAPVEVGILLDLLVAVFVMGIAMFHINREFDSMAVHQLTELRD
jgi:hydrogenase-4 component E